MNQQFLFKVLGMSFKKMITENGLPTLDKSILTPSDTTKLRAYLYNAPHNNESLCRNFINLLHKGKIEEAELNGNSCIFTICIEYKREQYHAQVKLEQNQWSFITLYYTGKTTIWKADKMYKNITILIISVSLLSLLLYVGFSFGPILFSNKETANKQTALESDGEDQEHSEQNGINIDTNNVGNEKIEENTANNLEEDTHDQLHVKEQEEKDQVHNEEDGMKHIVIHPGMTSLEIAELLYQNGIITDAEELDQYFYSQRVNKRLRWGSYQIPQGATYQELVHILTNPN